MGKPLLNTWTPRTHERHIHLKRCVLSISLFGSRSVFRHYRVTQRDQGGYVIDVENPVSAHLQIEVYNGQSATTLKPQTGEVNDIDRLFTV